MELIAIRHTKVEVPAGVCYGISDVLPAADFKNEAILVKNALDSFVPDAVYCSPLMRCTMLASECGYANILQDNRLQEMNFGEWEMTLWNSLTDDYAKKWFADFLNVACPGGESLRDVVVRLEKFLIDLNKKDFKTVFCFTHSGPIRILNYLLKDIPLKNIFELDIAFGGVYTFKTK